ncbi:MAG TPA: triose-phosphate isomerase [Candidatus Sulfobium mesophilum]|jgi:triosephosphate isomerase|nr:triose-phosphate isomerase [Candidatus Sulfobium mesophilum]
MKRYFIAANWKMNKTVSETREFVRSFVPLVKDATDRDIVIAPPFTALAAASEELKGSDIRLSAQDMFWEEKGAYTGEISPVMLADAGCAHVIVGHSERRQYFSEDDVIVNRKAKAAKKAGFGVIFCCGETLEEREAGRTFEVIKREVEAGLAEVGPDALVVAYEPIWAIGTGRTATTEQAQDVHAFISNILGNLYGSNAEGIRIIYGGSVTPENVDALMACKDVFGALVGGASLKPESFARIALFKKEK